MPGDPKDVVTVWIVIVVHASVPNERSHNDLYLRAVIYLFINNLYLASYTAKNIGVTAAAKYGGKTSFAKCMEF